jgi:hypothetical protein
MKIALGLLCFFTVASFLPSPIHATDFVFSSFQCDPSECIEQTAPTTVGTAFVSFNATCTGGAVSTIEGSALAQIGVPEPCTAPFIAFAQIQQSTTTELDDFGCPFNLSSVTQTAKVFSAAGVQVFSDVGGSDCQGGTFGPTNDGTKPC